MRGQSGSPLSPFKHILGECVLERIITIMIMWYHVGEVMIYFDMLSLKLIVEATVDCA